MAGAPTTRWGRVAGLAVGAAIAVLLALPGSAAATSHNSITYRTCDIWSDAFVWYSTGLRNYRYGGQVHACGGNPIEVWRFNMRVTQIDNLPSLSFTTTTWMDIPQHGNWVGITWCRFDARSTGQDYHRMFCRYYRA